MALDENLSPSAALYVGQLEGTIAALVINEVKMRSYLELITGDPWQLVPLPFTNEALQQLATETVAKQTGLPLEDAKKLVADRISLLSPASAPSPTAESVVPNVNSPDMIERLQSWKDRKSS